MSNFVIDEYRSLLDQKRRISAEMKRSSTKKFNDELSKITERMHQIEQEAKLHNPALRRKLFVYEQCSGMDEMPLEERAKCVSFGAAMTALEGTPVPDETTALIQQWANGEIPYLRIYKITLGKYGVEIDE